MRRAGHILLTFFLAWTMITVYAQPGNPGGEPGVPLDGGLLTLLIGSGLAYLGMKNRKDPHKKE